MQYIEIIPKTKNHSRSSREIVYLSNGDIILKGGSGTIFAEQWFYIHHISKFHRRLPKANTYEEALEEYQQATGNCIVGV